MLPKLPIKEPRPIAVTVRLSKRANEGLKILAKEHNLSQADVVEFLILETFNRYVTTRGEVSKDKGKKSKSKKPLPNKIQVLADSLTLEELLAIVDDRSHND